MHLQSRTRATRGAAKMPEENIFLFVPNLIGECSLRPQHQRRARDHALAPRSQPVPLPSHAKVMPGLSSPSFPSTSCPAAPSRPPPSICSVDFWTPSMDTRLEPLIKVTEFYHYRCLGTQQPPALFLLSQCGGNISLLLRAVHGLGRV